jgi:UDP-perosamine 4-acetyltransferase
MKDERALPMVIIGAGTYGSVIFELATECGYKVELFLDDRCVDDETSLEGVPVRGPIERQFRELPKGWPAAVAIGNSKARFHFLDMARTLGKETPSLISPHAIISASVELESACYLHVGSHVWSHVKLGFGTILSPYATVAHHSTIGKCCLISTGAHVGASIFVGDYVMMGMSATIVTGVHSVGDGSTIGASACVVRDVLPGATVKGVPAR